MPGDQAVVIAGRTTRRLSPEEMEERCRKGQCYNCNEKYVRGHNKTCKHLFTQVIVVGDEPGEEADDPRDEPHISLHAITGLAIGETMQIIVRLGTATFTVLLDSGSTHNFVTTTAAESAGLDYQQCSGLHVMVANGDHIPCPGVARHTELRVDDTVFLPLGGYDMVLGTQWLATLGPILWDFRRLTMSFWQTNRHVRWQGIAGPRSQHLHACSSLDLVQLMLAEFNDIFTEPQGLPPLQSRAHKITLLRGTPPIAVRPYRYPANQKDELERQCRAMEAQGLIRRSSSAYSSLALLVKKANGS